ncbi:MAG: type II CRISPR RNA-guided endonuclease Cas9 [Flammeovirgaceae bacterium]|jgi:CRISPR-associated endonuclease Csn1|nr:type II CRISPR RNA-guided endonuclease Cas9 [Flammeovirgaceae bacterium]
MENKKIVGLDVGTSSIGWAVINEAEGQQTKILGIGSRIIPLATDEKSEFESGNAISKNQKRTLKRTQRKGYDRYQLRKENLGKRLIELGMMPDTSLFALSALELYGLRAKATYEKITLPEIGRILFHLNQKRGYKSSRKDESKDKKETDYVAEVNSRHEKIKQDKITIGQYFYSRLQKDERYRIKDQIFPRAAYIEEFNAICSTQQEFYPEVLIDNTIRQLRDEIIYYQRPLKSQKGLVSICEFEAKWFRNKEGREVLSGPKVTPRSSPLFQVSKLWETINNISINSKRGEPFTISIEKKKELFNYLDNNEKLSEAELFKILGIGKNEGYYGNKQLAKGLQGNLTKTAIAKVLQGSNPLVQLLTFDLTEENYQRLDIDSGELAERIRVNVDLEQQPLFKLWHVLYSIPEEKDIVKKLVADFDIPEDLANQLAKLDFTRGGFSNKSSKATRHILPYLQQGAKYSDAMTLAGYSHSDSLSRAENLIRPLKDKLKLLPKNSLRQPVVEKILNQLINLVNAIIDKYGKPDEIRIELARELKQSLDERNTAFKNNNKRETENKGIAERLHKEYHVKANRRNIEKWRLYDQTNGNCLYCGNKIELADFLNGDESDVEHIIPKAKLFDDSFQNKVISHRRCNKAKGDSTAYDYMLTQSTEQLSRYEESVAQLFKDRRITKAKRDKLLMAEAKIPSDFIARQLRETQYIARKSRDILQEVCRNVWATSGSVTEKLRKLWGWEEALMHLQLDKYKTAGKTEWVEYESNGQTHKKERIIGWTKRDDHRHHAIDALTIACTQQGFIQRINTLNSKHTRNEMLAEVKDQTYREKLTLLEKSLLNKRPFDTASIEKHLSQVLISFKSGKKVAVIGKRKVKKNGKKIVRQEGIVIPRGPLSEESVYGKIKVRKYETVKLSPAFDNAEAIINKSHKALVNKRLDEFNQEPAKAFKGLAKNPIWIDASKTQALTSVDVISFKDEYVIKYPIGNITLKDLPSIVDKHIRQVIEKRLSLYNNNAKEAFKDLENNPVWFNEEKRIPIRTVRCFTGLDAVAPVKFNDESKAVGFVKPGNNHHIAIYQNEERKKQEHVVTFWDAVERKMNRIPVVIRNPKEIWDIVLSNKEKYSQDFLAKLPEDGWTYTTSIQQNEMFVFNLSNETLDEAIRNKDNDLISKNLFRVRKLTEGAYWFNHHLETEPKESVEDKKLGKCVQASLTSMTGIKVKIDCLGNISRA